MKIEEEDLETESGKGNKKNQDTLSTCTYSKDDCK